MRELPLVWRVTTLIVVVLSLAFVVWKSNASSADWMGEHLGEFLGSMASAVALGFIAYAANIQSRQARSQELLTAFALARGDLETLSRNIAVSARLVVETRRDGAQGKLESRQAAFDKGDRTAFARLFGHGDKIQKALRNGGEPLRHQTRLYIQLFEGVMVLTREAELKHVLLKLPLGRAYCALKVAADEDLDGHYLGHLKQMPVETDEA